MEARPLVPRGCQRRPSGARVVKSTKSVTSSGACIRASPIGVSHRLAVSSRLGSVSACWTWARTLVHTSRPRDSSRLSAGSRSAVHEAQVWQSPARTALCRSRTWSAMRTPMRGVGSSAVEKTP